MKNLISLLTLMFLSFSLMAQVGINTPTPDKNSVLDLNSGKNKGLLIPRMTTSQREGMSSVKFSQGMMVYDTDLDILFVGYGNGVGATDNTKWYAMNPWKTEYRTEKNGNTAHMTTMTAVGIKHGNVGIGTTSPTEKLHVAGKVKATVFVGNLAGNATTATTVTGATQTAIKTVGTLTKLNVTGKVGIGTALNVTGKVGIGTASPGYPLHVVGEVYAEGWLRTKGKVGWYSQTYGGGWYMTDNTWIRNYNYKPVYLNSGNATKIALEVKGRVGIGTASPAYPLHVKGSVYAEGWLRTTGSSGWYSQTHGGGWHMTDSKWIRASHSKAVYIYGSASYKWKGYFFNEKAGILGGMKYHNANSNIGLLCAEGIVGDWVGANSDERIKDIIGRSNSEEDLSNLLSIAVTDYKMKDKVKYGEKISKKVIAQQLKTLYPQAVSLITKVVPDIYKLSEIKDGYIALETDLEKGDRVKLIFEGKEEVVEVIKTNRNGFFIDNKKEGKVFVYGKEVNDFHVVDYDAVSMLNVSATQELYKLILKQHKIIKNQKTEIKAQLEVTKKNQSDFDKRIKALENRDNITTSNK